MQSYHTSEIAAQVDKMRADIERCGESVVGCHELSLLCPETSPNKEKIGVQQIAEWEGWIFEQLSEGHMRFIPRSVALIQ